MTTMDPGPYGADTDDAICALIDGELAGFAADTNRDPDEVRATLEQWRGFAARKAMLERARTAMSVPVDLDDTTRTELIDAAMAAAAPPAVIALTPRKRRMPAVLSAAAALLVVIVGAGVAFSVTRTDERDSNARLESAAQQPTGMVDNVAQSSSNTAENNGAAAKTPLSPTSPTAPTPAIADANPSDATTAPTITSARAARPGVGELNDLSVARVRIQDRIAINNAVAEAAGPCNGTGLFPAGSTIVLSAPGTLNGAPVEVIAARSGPTTLVVVVLPTDCSVLRAFTL